MKRTDPLRRKAKLSQKRMLLCEESARIMIDEGCAEISLARSKAAKRLNLLNKNDWPADSEIESVCQARIKLFSSQDIGIKEVKLDYAEQGMRVLGQFSPRLTGQLVRGPVLKNTTIQIHVFADILEDVLSVLEDNGISVKLTEKQLYFTRDKYKKIPTILLDVDSHPIEIYVFSQLDLRRRPLSPVNQKPVEWLSIDQLRARRSSS